MRNAYIIVEKPIGNRPIGTPRRKWGIVLKMKFGKVKVLYLEQGHRAGI
jgi:hypothetical protein